MLKKFALIFTLVCGMSYAQLSVRNSSYIFINDEVVFVEDDINLNETNSSIYLRNEAQVVQGSGTTGNSGVGEFSVYQEANVGEYEYNYWCSPVGSKTSNNTNNPFGVTLLNDVTGLITSTPATIANVAGYNGTSSPLTIEQYWIWKFIASDEYSEWIHVQGATTINPGEGFTMKGTSGSSDAQRYDFRGKPNNGTISVSVLNNQFTLTGNPYPSALDALAYIHDTENAAVITGVLHYWEQDPSVNSHYLADYDGGYATYTISSDGLIETFISAVFNTYNGDGTINVSNTAPGSKTARRYIPIGQGFMVEGTATGTVKAKNTHRVFIKESNANSEFFKNNNKGKKTSVAGNRFSKIVDEYKRFRLNIDFNNTYTRQIVQTFHNSATGGFDYGLEIKTTPDELLDNDAYFESNGNIYLAEALPFDASLKIPLNINLTKDSPIKVRSTDVQNFDSNQAIYIHDLELDTYTDLKTQDFEINLEAGNYTTRFEIVFNKNSLNTLDTSFENLKVFQNNNVSLLKISNPNAINLKSFYLYDITGKKVLKRRRLINKKEQSYSTKSFSDGVYIAKIVLDNNQVLTKKVVIANKN